MTIRQVRDPKELGRARKLLKQGMPCAPHTFSIVQSHLLPAALYPLMQGFWATRYEATSSITAVHIPYIEYHAGGVREILDISYRTRTLQAKPALLCAFDNETDAYYLELSNPSRLRRFFKKAALIYKMDKAEFDAFYVRVPLANIHLFPKRKRPRRFQHLLKRGL